MAKSKKKQRWLMLYETDGHHKLRDAKTGRWLLLDVARAEIDAYLAKVEQADGLAPEISHMGGYTR
jgi:hypothetical protein